MRDASCHWKDTTRSCRRSPTSSSRFPTTRAIKARSRTSRNSTKQRFVAIDFGYPPPSTEASIIVRESGTDDNLAGILVAIGARSRNLQGHGLDEGASTRMLIHAGRMVRAGLPLEAAVQSSIVLPITDNPDIRAALTDAIQACLP